MTSHSFIPSKSSTRLTLSGWWAGILNLITYSAPAEEILPELESGGIKDLVRVIRGRFTSSLVSHGDTSIKPEHLHGTDPELHVIFSTTLFLWLG